MSRDHFVPQTYLKRFSEWNESLNVFFKEQNKWGTPNKKSICCINEWDILKNSDKKNELSSLLKRKEPNLNKWIDCLILKKFETTLKKELSEYLSTLMLMNPKNIKNNFTLYNNFIPRLGEDNVFDETAFRNDSFDLTKKLKNILYFSEWVVLENNTDFDFITCDNPFHFLNENSVEEMQPYFLPLDTNHALKILSPSYEDAIKLFNGEELEPNKEIKYELTKRNTVRNLNISTISNSERFIIEKRRTKELEHFIEKNKMITTEPSYSIKREDGKTTILFYQKKKVLKT